MGEEAQGKQIQEASAQDALKGECMTEVGYVPDTEQGQTKANYVACGTKSVEPDFSALKDGLLLRFDWAEDRLLREITRLRAARERVRLSGPQTLQIIEQLIGLDSLLSRY